jgi:hypothetical protein
MITRGKSFLGRGPRGRPVRPDRAAERLGGWAAAARDLGRGPPGSRGTSGANGVAGIGLPAEKLQVKARFYREWDQQVNGRCLTA